MLRTKATSTIFLIMIPTSAMIKGATASRINAHHDASYDNYAYAVYSCDWECQDVTGIKCVLLATSSATCNFYADTSCADYLVQLYINEGVPSTSIENSFGTLILGDANSIACAS
jgi:hypothetical protein